MAKLDLQKEKERELASIWGSEVNGDARYPRRRCGAKKIHRVESHTEPESINEDVASDLDSNDAVINTHKSDRVKKKASKKRTEAYRLHCFVEPGTSKNAVRTVFDAYEPKVELRITQKGNLLNKSQYAVLTFRNKAMALHAVKTMDGTNQRDMLGVSKLKLNLMLNRHQSSIVRRKLKKIHERSQKEKLSKEAMEDVQFIEHFISQHIDRK